MPTRRTRPRLPGPSRLPLRPVQILIGPYARIDCRRAATAKPPASSAVTTLRPAPAGNGKAPAAAVHLKELAPVEQSLDGSGSRERKDQVRMVVRVSRPVASRPVCPYPGKLQAQGLQVVAVEHLVRVVRPVGSRVFDFLRHFIFGFFFGVCVAISRKAHLAERLHPGLHRVTKIQGVGRAVFVEIGPTVFVFVHHVAVQPRSLHGQGLRLRLVGIRTDPCQEHQRLKYVRIAAL